MFVHVPVEALSVLPSVALPLIVGGAVFTGAVDPTAGDGAPGEVFGGTSGGNNGDGFLRLPAFTQRCARV
jgi:hypothetical protein